MSFSSGRRPPAPRRRRTRKYRSENSMELLPAEESACYRAADHESGKLNPSGSEFGQVTCALSAGYRDTRAAAPRTTASTSASVTIDVSPGVVMASAPWATPYSSAHRGSRPVRKP